MVIETRVDVMGDGTISFSLVACDKGGETTYARRDHATFQEAVDFQMLWLGLPEEARQPIEQDLMRMVTTLA